MKKLVCIIASLFCVFCLSSACLAAPKAKKATKASAPQPAKAMKTMILANGPETKDSFVSNFEYRTFFAPPFKTKLPELPFTMEVKRFGSLVGEDSEPQQELEAGDVLEPGYVYALRTKNSDYQLYKLVLNPISKKPEQYTNAKLFWQEINELITFIGNGEEFVMQKNSHPDWFDESFNGCEFLFVPLHKKVQQDAIINMPIADIYKGKYDSEEYNMLGISQPVLYGLAGHNIFVDRPYRLENEILNDFFLNDFHLQKTVPVSWLKNFELMYSTVILQKKGAENDPFEDADGSVMVEADKIKKKIAQRMVYDMQISEACIKQAKGNLRDTINLKAPGIDTANSDQSSFKVEARYGDCCGGARRCAVWVYKRIDDEDNYYKVLGPVYPDEVEVLNESNDGMADLRVMYPMGINYSASYEIYRFQDNFYQITQQGQLR